MNKIVPQAVSDKDWEDLRQAYKAKQERARAIAEIAAEENELKKRLRQPDQEEQK